MARILGMTEIAHLLWMSRSPAKAAMTLPATFSFDSPGDAARAAELRRVKALATLVLAGTLALFVDREGAAAAASGVRLRRGVRGSRHHRRACRLVCGGGAVPQAARAADPAHRDHPEQSASHRRKTRRIHRAAFSRSRAGGSQTAPGRFRLLHRRLAARPQAQHRSRALRAAPAAGSGGGDGNLGPDGVRHPARHHAIAVDRPRAARGRHAARLRRARAAIRACSTTSCA